MLTPTEGTNELRNQYLIEIELAFASGYPYGPIEIQLEGTLGSDASYTLLTESAYTQTDPAYEYLRPKVFDKPASPPNFGTSAWRSYYSFSWMQKDVGDISKLRVQLLNNPNFPTPTKTTFSTFGIRVLDFGKGTQYTFPSATDAPISTPYTFTTEFPGSSYEIVS